LTQIKITPVLRMKLNLLMLKFGPKHIRTALYKRSFELN
jgi:hypothetical protein